MWYFLRADKFPACLLRNEITPEIINKMRLQMNQYLKKNPDFFLNKGYEINISLDLIDKQGNILERWYVRLYLDRNNILPS